MMKRFLIVLVLIACILPAAAQGHTAAGVWSGGISIPGGELRVVVKLQQKDDRSWTGTIDIPMQSSKDVPLTDIRVEAASVSFSIVGAPGNPTFSGTLSEDGNAIAGDFMQGPAKLPFKLTRTS